MSKKIENLLEFEDQFNPQHFYCRLKELGINKNDSKKIARDYEVNTYKVVMNELKRLNKKCQK